MQKKAQLFTSKEDSHEETVDGTIGTETVEPTCTAEGTITFTANSSGKYKLYWADDNNALSGYLRE